MKYILRNKNRNGSFFYTDSKKKRIENKEMINHATSIRIPPAYTDVKIFTNKNAKVFAIGIDDKGRKQYIYNPKHTEKQSKKKYCEMIKFGDSINRIYTEIQSHISKPGMSREKIIATAVKMMLSCNFRIGNEKYKKKYQSYGITTIGHKHVKLHDRKTIINFIGKKGVDNYCEVIDRDIIEVLKYLYKNGKKGDNLFRYKGRNVTSDDVNLFLKKFGNFTTKQFRTWSANMLYIQKLQENVKLIDVDHITKRKKLSVAILKEIAPILHHTPAICKKSYVNNDFIDLLINKPKKMKSLLKTGNSNDVFTGFLKMQCS